MDKKENKEEKNADFDIQKINVDDYDNFKDIVIPGFSYDGCKYNQVKIKK